MERSLSKCAPVLSIAGSDSSAGAGIQQDLKTITALGGYGATVITALTAQNTLGVQKQMAVPADMVAAQLQSVLSDLDVRAVKIGMIPNLEVAQTIVSALRTREGLPVVLDPVMISTSGTRLMAEDCIDYITQHLFPLCTLVTPNLPEYELLQSALQTLTAAYLLKGGHDTGSESIDVLHMPDGTTHTFSSPRIASRNLHGTGCTLSSAIATGLASGLSLVDAIDRAKRYITLAIEQGRHLNIGHGNGPLSPKVTGVPFGEV